MEYALDLSTVQSFVGSSPTQLIATVITALVLHSYPTYDSYDICTCSFTHTCTCRRACLTLTRRIPN